MLIIKNYVLHIINDLNKIAKNNGVLSKIGFFNDLKTALLLYYKLIYHIVILCGHPRLQG